MRHISAAILASLVVGLAALVGQAGATSSSNVQLLLRERYDYATIDWTASSPISGAGTWQKGLLTFHGGKGSPVWAGTIKTTLTSAVGSFEMTFQGLGNGNTGVFSGTWQISRGTGAYARIHGSGTWHEDDEAQPGIVVFPCEGDVHFD